jgi:hypothetical protein
MTQERRIVLGGKNDARETNSAGGKNDTRETNSVGGQK